jgi:hypothetical protein
MKTNFNLSKMRCKKLHWMTEVEVWGWWEPFIDSYDNLYPKHAVLMDSLRIYHSNHGWAACNYGFEFQNFQKQGPPRISASS